MTKKEFDLLYYIKKNGKKSVRELSKATNISAGSISTNINILEKEKLIDDKGITKEGLKALEPYKVDNAIILAAGLSSRFVPFSIEKPKGLWEVKGEVLVERQIEQLKAAGINDITLVLGYKKEMFFYLEKKYGVNIVINGFYNVKNNVESLYCVKDKLKNTYICSSDNYFVENVFEDYVYQSYYSSIHVNEKTNEWYMEKGKHGLITKISKFGQEGYIMLGHVYLNKEFSSSLNKYIIDSHKTGEYDSCLWEEILKDHIKEMPPMEIREYPNNIIFEFDSMDELRKFDYKYVDKTESKIMANIASTLNVKESEICDFKPINEGLTNTSFRFRIKDKEYVYRHPGEGTEAIINRHRECKSLKLAKEMKIDPTFVYMNEEEGWKISTFVPKFHVPDYKNDEDSKAVCATLKKLHDQNKHVDWEFEPWEGALELEKLILEKTTIEMKGYNELKEKVKILNDRNNKLGVKKCFCHCDTYAPNWMITKDQAILIDWEYSGESDPTNDLATYIMDAMYTIDEAKRFLSFYSKDEAVIERGLANVAIVSFYWFVWAMFRESCGAVMQEPLHNWHTMAERFAYYLVP